MPRQGRTVREIALYFVAFYTVIASVLAVGAYLLGENALRRQLDNRIVAEAELLRRIDDDAGLAELQSALIRRRDRGVNNLGYLLTSPNGARLGGDLTIRQPAVGWRIVTLRDPDDGELSEARSLTTVLADKSRLTVAADTAASHDLQDMFLLMFLPGFAIMLAGGLAGGLLLGGVVRKRIKVMNDTAVAIIAGETDQRIPANQQGDEFTRLATTLNRMLDRNSVLIANLRQVSSDIAHDLRTPIAHLRQRLERAVKMTTHDQPIRSEIEGAIAQSEAILSLFAALLRISEVESGALHQYFERVDLSSTVRRVCESYALAAEDSGHIFQAGIDDDIALQGDAELLAQALVNLLENVLRHTPPGTAIHVRLSRDARGITLTISDDGPGVPTEHLPKLTQRFTRVDRARAGPGYGLGLNLVAAIIRAHAGTLTLSSQHPGLRVVIEFPDQR